MWRALDVFRPVALLYAVYSLSRLHPHMVRPWAAFVVLGLLAAWAVSVWFIRARTPLVVGNELALASAAILATRLVDPGAGILAGAPTVPSVWPSAAVVSWAVLR